MHFFGFLSTVFFYYFDFKFTGTSVGQVSATDLDTGINAKIR